ncbi:ABC transporter substrate-binding protein [Microvirga sp. BSC39]|uniref:ABC transporter substrate-binding protein n=1 Tax=Microvirga sp. BSC39 TaxID=1549810 RepID=UPI001FCC3FA1|nr:ABC transporter substrate-binding protein [Microvirga sp. BSC39]
MAAWPLAVGAQPGKARTILWVSTEAQPDPFIDGFREGMREHRYSEGQTLAFTLRYAPGDPGALRAMLPEILALPADLIVSSGPAIVATRAVTAKPVLFAISSDPVALGIAESLARPGRNFTGITFMSLDVAQKRVEILKELMPHLRTLAVLSNTTHPGEQLEYEATKRAAEALSLRLAYASFTSGADIDAALEQVRGSSADAMLAFPGGATRVHKVRIAEFARAHGLPSMFGSREHCEVGGLASYGAHQRTIYVRLAAYADRLLRGEKPGDLPIEQPTTFELVLNGKTARALGFEIPPSLLARADEVIE